MPSFTSCLITGASSGIGHALAHRLAAPGVILHLSGRDPGRLEAVADACRQAGAQVNERVLDVRDSTAMTAWIASIDRLDLVIANAGISAGNNPGTLEPSEQTKAIFDTNVGGVLNTALPAMQVMQGQTPRHDGIRGRIAVVASIAAFIAAPGAPSYCAAKAAVDRWTVATAPSARRSGILLTSVCPGYVRTAMTANNRFPMPGLMDADRAVQIMLRGIAAGRTRVTFPWWMGLGARVVALLPQRLATPLLSDGQ